MKKLLSSALALVMALSATAYDFMVDGFAYNYNDDGTSVTVTCTEYQTSFNYYGLTTANIPASVTYNGTTYSVTSIDDYAFCHCNSLTSVTIGNSVTSIGVWAFEGCSAMTSITIGNLVASIGHGAFYGVNGLESIKVESGNSVYDSRNSCNAIIETASNTLIYGCKNTTIPNSVTSIGESAFQGCSDLTSITIPNSVTSIGNGAFLGTGLTSIDIPNSVTSIDSFTFYACIGLTSVNIPNTVTSIGEHAFYHCTGLTSVIIPNSVTSIASRTFYKCGGLTSVTIGNSVTSIDEQAFMDCGSLTSITLTGYGSWNTSYKLLGLSQIIHQFKIINIGSGITSLGNFNFVPDVVNCYAETPPTCTNYTFKSYDGELHVPASANAAYFTADYWQNFVNMSFDANDKVELSQNEAALTQWDELELTVTVNPEGNAITWSSSKPSVATVSDDGVVTAVAGGECYIYVTLANNPAVYVSCHVTVSYPEISIVLNKDEIELVEIGDETTLIATITPNDTGLKPTWASSDESVVTVDTNGVVTAVSEGECDIIATVLDKTATCHVIVIGSVTITLDMSSATIPPNSILTIYPTCTPDVDIDFAVSSSDTSVAIARIVNRSSVPAFGAPALAITKAIQVLGIKDGTATITVGSVNGKAIPATCVVTVHDPNVVDDITGDVNGDGKVNVSDVSALINMILGLTTVDEARADVNGDTRVNVSDVAALINIILGIQ